MCLILFSYKNHPLYDLILVSNRDEFRDRPTEALNFWEDAPSVLAGRDLQNGGTWMGITRTGRFAAITNFRSFAVIKENSPSRGQLVKDYLLGKDSPLAYIEKIKPVASTYSGFNLLMGDMNQLFYFSNCKTDHEAVTSGLYGLSNNFLNVPWPKVKKGKQSLADILKQDSPLEIKPFFMLLSDKSHPNDSLLPKTGVSLEWERLLSPVFIADPFYGTRSQSVLLISQKGQVDFYERTIHRDNCRKGSICKRSFQIEMGM
ncbi:MAG: NRDE family protein [Candidatus Magnetomorum sp.]|nr:NRDE family protein [Candidatus Magnetomorum sp.]